MKKTILVLTLIVMAFVVIGCGNSGSKFVGKYQEMSTINETREEYKYRLIEISKPDKSFVLTALGAPIWAVKQQGLEEYTKPAVYNEKTDLLEFNNDLTMVALKIVEDGNDKILLVGDRKYKKISEQKFKELKTAGDAYYMEKTKNAGNRRSPKA